MKTQKNTPKLKQWAVIGLFLLACVLSAIFMGKVTINYNLADYLGKHTQTKIALDIIEDEFGMTGSVQVMAKNVSTQTADEIKDKIESIDNVLNVNFDKYDEAYYKDENALFIVIIDGDDYSQNAKQVAADIKTALSRYDGVEYGGTTVEKQALQDAITNEMTYILAISLCLVVAILLITSESWLEPFILLAASGVAVLINRGTNIMFGEISYITNSIAAILQLALSIDYSIVLLNTYRKQKANYSTNSEAMISTIKSVMKPVSASALTTIAGLLALLFMSFRIGFDIGIVLMKGIVISAITSLTLLPALVLILDRPMKAAHKKAFAPKGKAFCKTAFKASKAIVPIALILVVLCGVLQTGNSYLFTDTKSGNAAITEVFGKNNSVVVVYKNSENNYANEQKLADALYAYKTKDGKSVFTNYTAYTNTVREVYDIDKAVKKLDISESDARLLYTMYNLYNSPSSVKINLNEFVNFADDLIENDDDAKEFVDESTSKPLKTLKAVSEITSGEWSVEELYAKLTTGVFEGTDIKQFSLNQLYGMYFYGDLTDNTVYFKTMLNYIISVSSDENLKGMIDSSTVLRLRLLAAAITQFEKKAEKAMSYDDFKTWYSENMGEDLTDEQVEQLYMEYFDYAHAPASDTAPYLPLMKYLVSIGQITDENKIQEIEKNSALYDEINSKYGYESFLSALSNVARAFSSSVSEISVTNEHIQQVYIMYFTQNGILRPSKIGGKTFAEFAINTAKTNDVVKSQLTEETGNQLLDMITVANYCEDTKALTYVELYEKLLLLTTELKSQTASGSFTKDKISGVYIKYAVKDGEGLTSPMMACELLDFISDNMDTNSLLVKKMSDENRNKVADAQADVNKANDLFVSENYSRMLLSVNLSNESKATTEFVDYLSKEVKAIFGDDAYITGEIVSTYDLQNSFKRDNLLITVFTLVSIFVIVMLIFRSISLPIILVAIIQGAIFIAMSTQLLSHGVFFMSYIVTTCILMGATIDYGILMSSNYVADRRLYDKKQSLEMSVEAAMPTVFTSGLILMVCGFVIHFISSQNSISTVGLLIGIGTVCSVVMITIVLPSVLYLLDKFVLKLSLSKKK